MSILDFRVLKALSSHTRVKILAKLKSRHMTLSDLSAYFGMHPSSVKGHLDLLEGAGLIKMEDGERKWKYYAITSHGAGILAGGELRVSLPAVSGITSLIFAIRGWQPVGSSAPVGDFASSSLLKVGPSASSGVSSVAPSVSNVSSVLVPEAASSVVSPVGMPVSSVVSSVWHSGSSIWPFASSGVLHESASSVVSSAGQSSSSAGTASSAVESAASNLSAPTLFEPNATTSSLTSAANLPVVEPNIAASSLANSAGGVPSNMVELLQFPPFLLAVLGLLLLLVSAYFWRKSHKNLLKDGA